MLSTLHCILCMNTIFNYHYHQYTYSDPRREIQANYKDNRIQRFALDEHD